MTEKKDQEKKSSAFYTLPLLEIFTKFGTSEKGLTGSQAVSRLEKYGPNILEKEKALSALSLFFLQFSNPLIYVLLVADLVTLALGNYIDFTVISVAVFSGAILGFLQEHQAAKTLKAISKIIQPKAVVIRDETTIEITQDKIVPGDVIVLNPGDKVPADARLLEASDLRTNAKRFLLQRLNRTSI